MKELQVAAPCAFVLVVFLFVLIMPVVVNKMRKAGKFPDGRIPRDQSAAEFYRDYYTASEIDMTGADGIFLNGDRLIPRRDEWGRSWFENSRTRELYAPEMVARLLKMG